MKGTLYMGTKENQLAAVVKWALGLYFAGVGVPECGVRSTSGLLVAATFISWTLLVLQMKVGDLSCPLSQLPWQN